MSSACKQTKHHLVLLVVQLLHLKFHNIECPVLIHVSIFPSSLLPCNHFQSALSSRGMCLVRHYYTIHILLIQIPRQFLHLRIFCIYFCRYSFYIEFTYEVEFGSVGVWDIFFTWSLFLMTHSLSTSLLIWSLCIKCIQSDNSPTVTLPSLSLENFHQNIFINCSIYLIHLFSYVP